MSENIIVFMGVKYWEYKDDLRRGLFHSRTGRGLHRAIWESVNGTIPPRRQIHHRDGNRYNNDISNLECLTPEEHARRHYEEDPVGVIGRMRAGQVAAGYDHHRTPQGRAAHARGARTQFAAKPIRDFVCESCGKTFQRRCIQSVVRFCDGNCKMRAWRARSAKS